MIFETLSFLSLEVDKFLSLKLGVPLEPPRLKIGNVARALDNSLTGGVSLDGKAILTLVNVEEDRVIKQQENFVKSDSKTIYKNPPLYLNLYVLFSINATDKPDYQESLKWLGYILQFFQHQNVFTSVTHPTLDAKVHKLVVDLFTLSFEQLNHLWSTMGGKYLPSVMYKVRQVIIDEDATTSEAGFIREIQINEKIKSAVS
ncbi:MAG: DUF4255 domain-containing protein [Ferruginibacter sp.]